jgi:hypothetical protein
MPATSEPTTASLQLELKPLGSCAELRRVVEGLEVDLSFYYEGQVLETLTTEARVTVAP